MNKENKITTREKEKELFLLQSVALRVLAARLDVFPQRDRRGKGLSSVVEDLRDLETARGVECKSELLGCEDALTVRERYLQSIARDVSVRRLRTKKKKTKSTNLLLVDLDSSSTRRHRELPIQQRQALVIVLDV